MRNILHVALLFASALASGCLAEIPAPPAYPNVVHSPSHVTVGKDYCRRVFQAAEERRRGFNAAMTAWFSIAGLSVIGLVPSTVYLVDEAKKDDADVGEISMPILFGAMTVTAIVLGIAQVGGASGSTAMRNAAADGSLKVDDWDALTACVHAVKDGDVNIDVQTPGPKPDPADAPESEPAPAPKPAAGPPTPEAAEGADELRDEPQP